MNVLRACALAVGVLVSACEPPPVVATQDRRQNAMTAPIEGHVVVQGPARGRVVLFLFSADRPPPPEGTGRPVSFAVVSAESLFGASLRDGSTGPFTAPFTFSLVSAGKYLIKGFVDHDGCLGAGATATCVPSDFIPWYGVTAEPNAGDVGGGAVDPVTRVLRTVTVGEQDGVVKAVTEVSASFGESATLPFDRPSFEVSGTTTFNPTAGNKVLELSPTPLENGILHLASPRFLVRYIDADGNGVPDDANADGIGDFYPKVYVRKLADTTPPLLDENDLDKNGILDSGGKDYEHASAPADGAPDAVVLAAGFDPTDVVPVLTLPGGGPRMDPVPLSKLKLIIRPIALDASKPGAPTPLKTVPSGRYAITIVQFTGQTWRVPNELQPGVAPALGLPGFDSQQFFVDVP
jgi:hypothetical protein